MYLKSIEIQGFKSFAHKIKFDFHNGITAIVGPNGSGKSNVADAVRWVLGEQRIKQLRGGAMTDVIFSGTENRKPLSYASVAITLDNSDHQLAIDYEEVTVTRKLYRSGESDYLLNGSSCRLKDINELFYDTGIGKEGYSIIGQGQIDKILSGKPEERRELFDEAAGIVKFKRRKHASLKKLESEQANLVRVRDILSELEIQVGPLEKQAAKAKEYLAKKDELKNYDINMFLLENARLKDELSRIEENLTIAQDDLEGSAQKKAKMKSLYQEIEEQLEEIEHDIETSRKQLNETTLLKGQLENQIELLSEQIRSAKATDEHFEERHQEIQKEIEERKKQLDKLQADKETLKQRLTEKKAAEERAKEELLAVQTAIASDTHEIETSKSNIMELLGSRASTQAKIQEYTTLGEQLSNKKLAIGASIEEELREITTQQKEQQSKQREYEQVTQVIEERKQEIKTHEQEIKTLEEQLKKENDKFQIGQKAYHREHSRLESLKNITERYDGYGNSIKKVMDEKAKNPGLIGVVADIIKVDKDYEVAIETALGGSIQNIVTKDEETAKAMIAFLKRNKFGRATFLPLTSIRPNRYSPGEAVLKEEGVIGVASSLAKVADKYETLSQFLLGRTIVVKDIEVGSKIARKYNQSLRLVTLEGELINPGGSMTGGAFRNSSNLLSRRREIEEFEKTVVTLKQELEAAEKEVQSIRARRGSAFAAIDRINEGLKEEFVRQNTIMLSIESIKGRIDSLKKRTKIEQDEIYEVNEKLNEIALNQDSIQVDLDSSKNLESDLNAKIEELNAGLVTAQENLSACRQKAGEANLAYAAASQEVGYIDENVNRVQEEIAKHTGDLEALLASKEGAGKEIEEKEKEIADIRQTIEDSKELFAEINQAITDKVATKDQLNAKNKDFLEKREEISAHLAELDKEIYRLETRKESYQQSVEKQIEYMWDEYEITLNAATQMRDENLTDLKEMRRRITEIKNEIRKLGDVNVNAIEDYKQVSERYEFLNNQHNDLVEAEKTLMKIIAELDEAMRKQFTEQFAKIKEEFDTVFKELFGGGKGTLELVEEEDVLEAGIKIIAQPPGKKLQNMMQLSGGEKALTAISLLFAIQNLKPSPFALLDEIEAALDDSNVGRFANYLHKLTKNTQFIVITHRRGTMTAADRLYGITMQEKGVSALVSVSLLEDELEE
ncbi:chromosome segregation protein [Lachnospiraceae bacterium PM6-15]|uniref:chromosome segregation protein SMC n=1 Tax=Ohessyouella blattaphilus TaxID=2949333 RepID=UPI003E1EE927